MDMSVLKKKFTEKANRRLNDLCKASDLTKIGLFEQTRHVYKCCNTPGGLTPLPYSRLLHFPKQEVLAFIDRCVSNNPPVCAKYTTITKLSRKAAKTRTIESTCTDIVKEVQFDLPIAAMDKAENLNTSLRLESMKERLKVLFNKNPVDSELLITECLAAIDVHYSNYRHIIEYVLQCAIDKSNATVGNNASETVTAFHSNFVTKT